MIDEATLVTMNETDVRETIVRPFLHQLGYRQGTEHNIRTEIPLRYPYKSLGRRKPTDPPLRGKPDYVCEVIPFARWVLEVKGPNVELSSEDVFQAHSYAVHPEIAARLFALTNGRWFRVYLSDCPDTPVMEWKLADQDAVWVNIQNLLGPNALSARAKRDRPDTGKALSLGLGSTVRLAGGLLSYDYHDSDSAGVRSSLESLAGTRATVIGDDAERNAEGLIQVVLRLAGPKALWDDLNRLAGVETYRFTCADEYISGAPERPSIFQGMTHFKARAGTAIAGLPGLPAGIRSLPFDMNISAFTQATGYLQGDAFVGTFVIEYSMDLPISLPGFNVPKLRSGGTFEIRLATT